MLVGSSIKEIVNLKVKLAKEFSMKELSPEKKILRMWISREKKKAIEDISQAEFVEKLLKRFNMSDAKHVNIPARRLLQALKGTDSDDER